MNVDKLNTLKKWCLSHNLNWTVSFSNQKLRIATNLFIADWDLIREFEKDCGFVIDDVLAHSDMVVLLCINNDGK